MSVSCLRKESGKGRAVKRASLSVKRLWHMVDASAVVDSECLVFVGDVGRVMDAFVANSEGFVDDNAVSAKYV